MKKSILTSPFKKLTAILLFTIAVNFTKAQCSANFTYAAGAGGNVTFTSTSLGTTSNTAYYWNFGDGGNYWAMANPNASHLYSYNGIFNVSLTITDSLGPCTSSIVLTVTVNNAPCVGNAAFNYNQAAGGLVNFFNNSGVGPNGIYAWGFGDGTTSNLVSPGHTYTLSGLYNVTLTATDQLGICSYSTVQSISVTVASCSLVAGFTYTLGAGGTVNFASTSTGTTPSTNYFWSFGDGAYGNGPNPIHTYSSNGVYNAYLTVSDSVGFFCMDSLMQTINVNGPCFANVNFTMAKDTLALPAIVWDAFPSYPGNIIAANWTWGDGSSTLALYPSHTYSAAGLYSICVSITVACGSTATACSNNNIYRTSGTAESNAIAMINIINPLPTAISSARTWLPLLQT